jgi:hypothetical protein
VEAVEHVTLAVGEFALNHSVGRTGKVSGLHDGGGTLLLRKQTFAFIRGNRAAPIVPSVLAHFDFTARTANFLPTSRVGYRLGTHPPSG